MSVTRKKYSAEQRELIKKEARETGSIAIVAKNHGVSYQTLANWLNAERKQVKRQKKHQQEGKDSRINALEIEAAATWELFKKSTLLWLLKEVDLKKASR